MTNNADNNSDNASDNSMMTWDDAQVVHITGTAPLEFLQGYLTCDVLRAETAPVPMALCNLKGRVICSGWLAQLSEQHTVLLVHRTLAEQVVSTLAPYARFSRCSLESAAADVQVSASAQGDIGGEWQWHYESPQEESDSVLQVADPSSTTDASALINRTLIRHNFAWISAPVSGKFLPQMLGLHAVGAVDFDKGCYLGQEIVARAQHRGAVKRQLQQFEWQSQAPEIGGTLSTVPGSTVIATSLVSDDKGNSDMGHSFRGTGLLVA